MTTIFLASAVLLLQACTAVGPGRSARPVSTADTQESKDPLIGKIVDTKTKAEVPFAKLLEALSSHDVIYLSEKHDNPMHHAVQRRIIQQLNDLGKNPVVGFEFFAMDDTPLLLNFMDSRTAAHSEEMEKGMEKEMRTKLGWDEQSDTMWGYYWDLLKLARDSGLQAAGLDLNTSQKRRITRKGMDGLTLLEQYQLFSTGLSDPAYESHMKEIFTRVHCGMGHDSMLTRLYDTWLARNDRMALSITQLHRAAKNSAPEKGPVVVIVGNGHTEYGLGIMDRVRAIDPEISQVNLSLSEVAPEALPLDEYLDPLDLEGHPGVMPADFIWFTGRVSNEDPCEKFKASIQRMKQQKKNTEDN